MKNIHRINFVRHRVIVLEENNEWNIGHAVVRSQGNKLAFYMGSQSRITSRV